MIYAFGDIVLDENCWVIRRGGDPLPTEPKVLEVLLYLIKNRDRIVTRDELLGACWPNVHVGDGTLSRCVSRIRQAIQQPRAASEPIFTRHGRGYRFVAPVSVREGGEDADEEETARELDKVPTVQTAEPERRLISLLDCAVALGEHQPVQDAEVFHAGVRGFLDVCSQVLKRFGGRLHQRTGEGVVLLFGFGISAEKAAEAAVLAGSEMAERAQEFGLTARLGIASGRAIIDPIGSGESEAGMVVEIDRLQPASLRAAAGPGQCVVDENTARLVEADFAVEPAGEAIVMRKAVPIFALSPRRKHVPTACDDMPFFGRTSELAYLEHCWKYAADGQGFVVHVTGEPGVGKSRLIRELVERVALAPNALLRVQCSPYHQTTPFYPLRALLHDLLDNQHPAQPDQRITDIKSLLERLGPLGAHRQPSSSWCLPDSRPSLGRDDSGQDQDASEDLVSLVFWLAEQQPAVLWVDDMQWADPSTLRVLESVRARASQARLLVLCSGRASKAPSKKCGVVDATTIALCPFTQAETLRFLEQRSAEAALPPQLIERIAAQTDGVPLYLREVMRLAMARPADLDREAVPNSLLSHLQSRLDEAGDAKRVAQWAAMLGRSFTKAILASFTNVPDDELEAALKRLTAIGLLSERGQGTDLSYSFNHSLIRDVAYGLMLGEPRRQRHRMIAETLLTEFPQIAAQRPHEIARHFEASDMPGRAATYWQVVGRASARRSARGKVYALHGAEFDAVPAMPPGLAAARRPRKASAGSSQHVA